MLFLYYFIVFIFFYSICIECIIIKETYNSNDIFPTNIIYKSTSTNEIKSVQCTMINKKKSNDLFYACIKSEKDFNINHTFKIKNRPNIRHKDTGYCSFFAFNDIFYAKTGLSLSNTDSILTNLFSKHKMLYCNDYPQKDFIARNQLLLLRYIDTEFTNDHDEIDQYFDQYECPNDVLNIYQQVGNLLYVDSRTENALWSKVIRALDLIYNTREKFCEKYKYDKEDILYDEIMIDLMKEMRKQNSGYQELILLHRQNEKLRMKNQNDILRVKNKAMELTFCGIFLPIVQNNDYDRKLDSILIYLRTNILIAASYRPDSHRKANSLSSNNYHTHYVIVLGYSKKKRAFKIKDSSFDVGIQIVPERLFLQTVYHISLLQKHDEII